MVATARLQHSPPGPPAIATALEFLSPHGRSAWAQFAAALAVAAGAWVAAMPAFAGQPPDRSIALVPEGPPPGFENLLQPQDAVVDVYFGGRRRGTARVRFEPGRLQFQDPKAVMALLPRPAEAAAIQRDLTSPLPTHPELVCEGQGQTGCGNLTPERIGIIFDSDRFRADIFINSRLLPTNDSFAEKYLPTPTAGPSIVEVLSGTVSGSDQFGAEYDLQSRTIAGFHAGRLRSDFSYSSQFGFLTDTLAAEIDRPGLRYTAGLFWTPGLDFIGQRRIYGGEVGTQIDSRADRDQAIGNQLVLYLPRRSQVDVFRDGHLLSSRFYEAGNQIIDTTSLPDGAYNLVLRIREIGGGTREEQRFFVKNSQIPLFDQPVYFVNIGLLTGSGSNPLPDYVGTPLVEAGTAQRLTTALAVDGTLAGTNQVGLGEAGVTYISDLFQLRGAGMVSTNGDAGILFNLATTSIQNFSGNFFAQRVWSHEGSLPNGFDSSAIGSTFPFGVTSSQIVPADGTQLSASLFYSAGSTQIGLLGSYQTGTGQPTSYSIGPTVTSTLWNDADGSGTLIANATLSDGGFQSFVGLRIQFDRPHYSVIAEGGLQVSRLNQDAAGARSGTGPVGSLVGTVTREDTLDSNLTVSGRLEHTPDLDTAGASADLQGRYGTYSAAVEHDSGSTAPTTNYAVNFTTAAAADTDTAAIGGQNSFDSSIVVRLDGSADNAEFIVLVNNQEQGRVSAGHNLPIFLPPYKRYAVRLVPQAGSPVDFDTSTRDVVLFPGNVETLLWQVDRVVDVFGRAIRPDGTPVANARILGARGIGATDDQGYFQIEASDGIGLRLQPSAGSACTVELHDPMLKHEYASVGSLVCK